MNVSLLEIHDTGIAARVPGEVASQDHFLEPGQPKPFERFTRMPTARLLIAQ
jgi:hypothetical protein